VNNSPTTNRRGKTRLPLCVPLVVKSLDGGLKFETIADTIDISSSGAQLRFPFHIPPGILLRLDVLSGDQIMHGRVVRSQKNGRWGFLVRVELLIKTGNCWRLKSPPADWNPFATSREDNDWVWFG
jgi:hypothetical protein